jgi:hypothetical protein
LRLLAEHHRYLRRPGAAVFHHRVSGCDACAERPPRFREDLCNSFVLLADHTRCGVMRARQPEPRARLLSPRLGRDETRSNSPNFVLPGEVRRRKSMVSDRTHSKPIVAEQWPQAGCAGCAGFEHTNPWSVPPKSECHKLFDGDIGFQMIYGKRRIVGMGDLLPWSATCQLLTGEGRLGRSPARPVISHD